MTLTQSSSGPKYPSLLHWLVLLSQVPTRKVITGLLNIAECIGQCYLTYDYTLSTVDRRVIDEENNQTRYECTIQVAQQINDLTLQSRIDEVAPFLSGLLPEVVLGSEYKVSCKFYVDSGSCTVINLEDEYRNYSKQIQLALSCC